jgi:4-hydroxy-tetrahydrodipicolinate synthase
LKEEPVNAIQGVNVVAVGPRRANGHEIDLGATLELIDFHNSTGVAGIALMGTTGEFMHLDFEERRRLMPLAVKRSRLPVIAGVAHSTLDGAVLLGRDAAAAGVAALLVMPPYFFQYQQDEIKEFYLEFARQVGTGVPIFLYNIPFFTNGIACRTAVELLETGLFAGIKDSSGEWPYFTELKEQRAKKPFTLLLGNDALFTRARSAGADGVISGVACAVPELMLGLDRAIAAGNTPKVEQLGTRLAEFIAWLNEFPTPVGVKEATAARGLKVGPLATPLCAAKRRKLAEFHEWLKTWLPAVQKEAANA